MIQQPETENIEFRRQTQAGSSLQPEKTSRRRTRERKVFYDLL